MAGTPPHNPLFHVSQCLFVAVNASIMGITTPLYTPCACPHPITTCHLPPPHALYVRYHTEPHHATFLGRYTSCTTVHVHCTSPRCTECTECTSICTCAPTRGTLVAHMYEACTMSTVLQACCAQPLLLWYVWSAPHATHWYYSSTRHT